MTAGKQAILVGHFRLGATEEIQGWILDQNDGPSIEIRLHRQGFEGRAEPADIRVNIPAALLPELRRLIQGLEEVLIEQGLSDEFPALEQCRPERSPIFAHPSEAEFARLLDFYKIRWQYEPKTFPIQWDTQGRVLESFTPDFYLPDQNLYIELTTRKQSLVTKKNRKVRLLKQLYPEVKIKIFYGRDFRQLLQKYGGIEGKK